MLSWFYLLIYNLIFKECQSISLRLLGLLKYYLHLFQDLITLLFLTVSTIQTDYRFCNHSNILYKLLFSVLTTWKCTKYPYSYKLHTHFISSTFLAVLIEPSYYRWITVFSYIGSNTSCFFNLSCKFLI